MNFSKIKKINWVLLKERDIDIAIESIYAVGQDRKFFKQLGINFDVSNHLAFSDGRLFFDQTEINQAEELFAKQQVPLVGYLKNITNRFIKLTRYYETFLRNNKNKDFNKISRQELAKVYSKYLSRNYSLIPYSFIVSIILEEVVRTVILEHFQKKSRTPEALYTKLVIPERQNKIGVEYIDRLKLALEFQQKSIPLNVFNKKLQKHLDRYSWLTCYRPTDNPLNEKTLRLELKKLLSRKNLATEIKNIVKEREKAMISSERALKQLHLPLQIKSLVKVMQQNVWVRTYRRELMSYGFYTMRPMHQTIARLMGVSFGQLKYFACWEIEEYLKNNKRPSPQEIKDRSRQFAIVKIRETKEIVSGKNFQRIKIIKKKKTQTKEIFGQSVYHGKIKSKVSIVRKKSDLKIFCKGDILVVNTVAVWMTPAVVECSAIVTDAGGVLMHSAIVAREFRKPCIIGTKLATQILKNGMMVSLDTQKGSLKIIN